MKREEWLKEYKTVLSDRDYNLIDRASSVLVNNVLVSADNNGKVLPWEPYKGICPSPYKYSGIWNWDAAFHAMAIAHWDINLAQDQFKIFFKYQQESGLFPDVIFIHGEVVSAFSKPPVFPWACTEVDQRYPDDEFLALAYAAYKKNERFWRTYRFDVADGLFYYDASTQDENRITHVRYESGWDDSVRWDMTIEELWPIDLNCYMVLFYQAMQYMCKRLGVGSEMDLWEARELELTTKINEKLWDEVTSAYYDVNRRTKIPTYVLSPASFMPLFIKIAKPEQAKGMAEIAGSINKFYPGMPTVSYDHPEYSSSCFWRGPTWLNTAYFAIKGLKNYGYLELSQDMKETILNWCYNDKRNIFEYYDSVSGGGLGGEQFGWSAAFIIQFILNFE